MKPDLLSDSPEVAEVVRRASGYPNIQTEVRDIRGSTRVLTEVYLLGTTESIPQEAFEEFPGVERVIRIRERYRAIGRHEGQAEAIGFDYNGVRFSQESFLIFAGLCAVDTRGNVQEMFRALHDVGIETTRAVPGGFRVAPPPRAFQRVSQQLPRLRRALPQLDRLFQHVDGRFGAARYAASGVYEPVRTS